MKKVLVLCMGNSCRSQMAHGYLQKYAGNYAEIFSAGVETHGVNPRAVQVMEEDGVDISAYTSNNVEEYLNIPFDFVITVCDNARERCPWIPGNAEKYHYNFPDPAKVTGSEEHILDAFRSVRDSIKSYCMEFVEHHIVHS